MQSGFRSRCTSIKRVRASNFSDCVKPIFHIQKWRNTHQNQSNRLEQMFRSAFCYIETSTQRLAIFPGFQLTNMWKPFGVEFNVHLLPAAPQIPTQFVRAAYRIRGVVCPVQCRRNPIYVSEIVWYSRGEFSFEKTEQHISARCWWILLLKNAAETCSAAGMFQD